MSSDERIDCFRPLNSCLNNSDSTITPVPPAGA
jgi:hypothetical protein